MSYRSILLAVPLAGASFLGACAHRPDAVAPAAAPAAQPAPDASLAPQAASGTPASTTISDEELARLLSSYTLHFGFDDATLTPESRQLLEKIAEVLRSRTDVHVRIEGNCDDRGTQEYNMALGQRRADAAKQALADLGVSADRIQTISWGFNHPVATGHDEQAWAMNRRDDIKSPAGG